MKQQDKELDWVFTKTLWSTPTSYLMLLLLFPFVLVADIVLMIARRVRR